MIVKKVRESVFKLNIDEAIDVAFFLGETLFYNQLDFPDVNDIETYFIKNILKIKYSSYLLEDITQANTDKNLFVITESYMAGGHTRLMENLSLMLDGDKDLLITRESDKDSVQRLEDFFNNTTLCARARKERSTDYIYRIVDEIIKYDRVFLNTQPEDIFTVIACGVAKKLKGNLKVFFVNHTDHTFTYGASVADIWFGISVYGAGLDKLRGVKGRYSFLGVVVNKPDTDFFKPVIYPKGNEVSKFITAASAHKFKPYKNESIKELLANILRLDNNKEVNVIGVDLIKNPWWWTFRFLYSKQIKFYNSLPYNEYLKVTQSADYYIDSHPGPGGTAFVEQFLQGVPCIGLKSPIAGYTPLEQIKKNSVEDVLLMLEHPPCTKYINNIQKNVFQVHAFSQVKNRFIDCVNNNVLYENPMLGYTPLSVPIFSENKTIVLSLEFLNYLFKKDKLLFISFLHHAGFIKNLNNVLKRAAFRVYMLINKALVR